MTTSAPTADPAPKPAQPAQDGRHNRSMKNYLIDSRFQLKYTSFIVGVSLVICGIMGVFLYNTSGAVVDESQKVVDESKKVSEVVEMNIKDDPVYSDTPELAGAVAQASSANDQKIEQQQQQLVHRQKTMLASLVGGLTLMVVLIGMLGIYFTHKVAGPIYKMKLLLKQVGDGKLTFRGGLRKGDELQDFFEAFSSMVEQLKSRQANEIELLEGAIEQARAAGASDDMMKNVITVRDEMKRALDQ
jgi:nitrogen fixation/metabolism regulation signal transduction histidine kinase